MILFNIRPNSWTESLYDSFQGLVFRNIVATTINKRNTKATEKSIKEGCLQIKTASFLYKDKKPHQKKR